MRPDGITLVFLTRGKVAIIDSADVPLILPYKWHATNFGYAARRLSKGGPTVVMHRAILGLPVNGGRAIQADHINRNRLDNRRCNLRIATERQNAINRKTTNRNGFRGVEWNARKSKWRSCISVEGKTKHLGYFTTAVDAARAYDAFARESHGDFAVLNFPDDPS